MASALQALILSAFVVCLVKGQCQLSQHDTEILIKLATNLHDKLGDKCTKQWPNTIKTYNTDTVIDNDLCNDLKTGGKARTSSTAGGCTSKEVDSMQKEACSLIQESNNERANLVIKFAKVAAKFSKTCQNKITAVGQHDPKTWCDVEQFCNKVEKTDVADFKKQCPGDEYGDLKDVACGGASNLVCGLLTIAMGLVAAIFKNL